MLGQTADYVAYGPDGQLALIAEIKNRQHTTREWASQLRRNMLAHGSMPQNAFFYWRSPTVFISGKMGGMWPRTPRQPMKLIQRLRFVLTTSGLD